MFLQLFKKKQKNIDINKPVATIKEDREESKVSSARKGELGEYKIDIQLDQLPSNYKYISDVMLKNPKSVSGFSQIDHIVITPYGIFVVETKNYQGTIYGGRDRKVWSVNGKFKMMNPFIQNYGHIQVLKGLLDSKFKGTFISIVSFTKRCTFKVDLDMRKITSDELIIYDTELTEFIQRKVSVLKLQDNTLSISETEIEAILSSIQKANITDPEIRKIHITAIQKSKEQKSDQNAHKCFTCNKPVSDKVAAFCLSNKNFQGKIYCYQHQKEK